MARNGIIPSSGSIAHPLHPGTVSPSLSKHNTHRCPASPALRYGRHVPLSQTISISLPTLDVFVQLLLSGRTAFTSCFARKTETRLCWKNVLLTWVSGAPGTGEPLKAHAPPHSKSNTFTPSGLKMNKCPVLFFLALMLALSSHS